MGINESGNVFVRLSFGVFLPLFSAAITPPLTQRNELNQLIQVQRYFGLCTGKQGRAVPVLIKIFPVSWMPRGIFPKNLVFPKALPFDAHEISRINSLMHKKNVVIMKTAREIHNGNKVRNNLPLHKWLGWSVQLVLSIFCWSLYGGNLLAWFVGLWLIKKLITDIIRFVWGCLVSILSFAAVIGIVIWLLTL